MQNKDTKHALLSDNDNTVEKLINTEKNEATVFQKSDEEKPTNDLQVKQIDNGKPPAAAPSHAHSNETSEAKSIVAKPNKTFAIVVVAVFLTLLILPTVLWGALSLVNIACPQIMQKLDFDLNEQREKAKLPDTFDPNKFTSQLEAYYNDHVPFRSVIFSANRSIDGTLNNAYTQTLRPFLIKTFYSNYQQSLPTKPTPIDPTFQPNPYYPQKPETQVLKEGDANCPHLLNPEMEIEPTCKQYGSQINTCIVCGYSERAYLDKSDHFYEVVGSVPATCSQQGQTLSECIMCRQSKCDYLEDVAHNGTVVKTVAPSLDDFGYTLYHCANCGLDYRDNFVDKLLDTSYFPPTFHGATLEGRNNWLFYTGNYSVDYYTGAMLYSEQELSDLVNLMQQLQNICEQQNKQLQFMLMPNKEMVYSEYMPSLQIKDLYRRSERFVDYVKSHSNVSIIYPLDDMLEAKKYGQIYFKHDTHWNAFGALVGANALYKALNMPTLDYRYIAKEAINREFGDLISLGGLNPSAYNTDTNYNIVYRPEISSTWGGDREFWGTGTGISNNPNGKKLAILSDSYKNALIPYLEKDFAECTATHCQNTWDAYVQAKIRECNVLVISAVERFDGNLPQAIRDCINILSQQ